LLCLSRRHLLLPDAGRALRASAAPYAFIRLYLYRRRRHYAFCRTQRALRCLPVSARALRGTTTLHLPPLRSTHFPTPLFHAAFPCHTRRFHNRYLAGCTTFAWTTFITGPALCLPGFLTGVNNLPSSYLACIYLPLTIRHKPLHPSHISRILPSLARSGRRCRFRITALPPSPP